MATPEELLHQSLAHLQAANRIDGSRSSYRKDMPVEYQAVSAYLQGGARPANVTSDMGMGLMLEEDARRVLAVPEPPPDPEPPLPPTAGVALDHFDDFKNNQWNQVFERRWADQSWSTLEYQGVPWSDGSGVYEISTEHGPGFDIKYYDVITRQSGALVGMADVDHMIDRQNFLGTTFELLGKFRFPAADNPKTPECPTGFPKFGDWNILWELYDGGYVNNVFGIDGYAGKIYVRTFKAGASGDRIKFSDPNTVKFDHWYDFRWKVKWARDASGRAEFWLDGAKLMDVVGATTFPVGYPNAITPYIEWGFYPGGNPQHARNRIQYAALRKV